MNEFAKAAENYTKSSELDDQFVFSHIQLAVRALVIESIGWRKDTGQVKDGRTLFHSFYSFPSLSHSTGNR